MANRFIVSGLDSRGRAVSSEVVADNLASARAAAERKGLTFVVAYPAFPPRTAANLGKKPPAPGRGAQRR